jgi:hypothetical protein
VDHKRLYLHPGDPVRHLTQRGWGIGVVVECATSVLPGGTCLVRVRFMDGRLRCFENNLDNPSCGYYFGLRHYHDDGQPLFGDGRRRRAPPPAIPSALLQALAAPDAGRALHAVGENGSDDDDDGDDGNGDGDLSAAADTEDPAVQLAPPERLVPAPPRKGGPMFVEARAAEARLTPRRKRP